MHAEISELLAIEPSEAPLISLYLDTSSVQPRRDYEPWLRGRIKQLSQLLEDPRFDRSATRVQEALSKLEPQVRGVAVFACQEPDILRVYPSDEPYENRLSAGHAAVIYPLVRRLDEQVALAVVLADSEQARIYTVRMGKLAEAAAVTQTLERPEKPGRGAAGAPRHGAGYGASQLKYQRYLRQQTEHYLKEVAAALQRVVEKEHLEAVMLAGNERITKELEGLLPNGLQEKLLGKARLQLTAGEDEILKITLSQLGSSLKAARLSRASSLVQEFREGGLAVLGVSGCLRNLARGQVEELLLLPTFAGMGRLCLSCHQVAPVGAIACHNCQGDLGPEVDLRELMARQAEETGALLEVVDAPELKGWEGVGAWLRYPEERVS
jgi:peptide subunit release factor 1 (eRF1)